MKIGILALQGAFIEHQKMLDALEVSSFEIRKKDDIKTEFDGLILPGGESTVIGKLLQELDLFNPIKAMIDNGLPVFGTCAGLILLAKNVSNNISNNDHNSDSYFNPIFSSMDITVKRNAYGRQLGSFNINAELNGIGKIPMVFIRAPYIESVSSDVEILATVDNKIVAAKQKKQLVTAFHPELSDDLSVHKYFLDIIKQ